MLKKLLSNPFPKVIYKTTSSFSGEIRVVQKGCERQLVVGGFVQSVNWDCPGVEKRVWGQIAENVKVQTCLSARQGSKLKSMPNVKVLVLGMGAGTEIHLLSGKYPGAQVTAVEVDPVIVKVAKDYFGVGKVPNLKIVVEDAFEYVEKTSQEFDTVICDFYAGGSYPKEADSDEFLTKVSKISKRVIFNRIFDSVKSPPAQEFEARLGHYFPRVKIVPVKHNALNILYVCATLEDKS